MMLVLSLIAQNNWNQYFSNDELWEVMYGEQPLEFMLKWFKNKIYKLKKILYGLKQVPIE